MRISKTSIFLMIGLIAIIQESKQQEEEDLKINFLPSDKYKLNKKDLSMLREDIERQIQQRVFEIQANWDERKKLRHNAIARPPVIPPYQIPSPPMTYPIQGNNFAASLNFDDPPTEPVDKLYDKKVSETGIENRLADFVDKKIQKELSTEIAVTQQAIRKLHDEIRNAKELTKSRHLNNNVREPSSEKHSGNSSPETNLLEKKAVKGRKGLGKPGNSTSANRTNSRGPSHKAKSPGFKFKEEDIDDADRIISMLETKYNKLSDVGNSMKFTQKSAERKVNVSLFT